MGKFTDRTGEINIALNGQKMTIIAYRSNTDLDVQFEDGTIVKNKTYQNFKTGRIKNLNYSQFNRVGEEKIANNGQKMKVIAWRNAQDIDVQFEDGIIVYHKPYQRFKNGHILNPEFTYNRVGLTNIATNGMQIKIIAYRSSQDLDVKFEDGVIVEHRAYKEFKEGKIGHPQISSVNVKYSKNRIGESVIMSNGQRATIIAYRGHNNVDIQFEDGTITTNKDYHRFKAGHIGHSDKRKNAGEHLGESKVAANGQLMVIIAYRGVADIDIQFEDGTIVKKKNYSHFKKGYIENPNYTIKPGISYNEIVCAFYLKQLGFKKYNAKQLKEYGFGKRELDLFNPNFNGFKVAIEYDGGKFHNYQGDNKKNEICKKSDIYLIRIREPQLPILKDELSTNFILKSNHLYSDNLLETLEKVVEYLNSEFGTTYKLKIDRDIDEIQIDELVKTQKHNKHIGEKRESSCKQIMEIIMWRNYSNIDILFEDGTVVKHKHYRDFKAGKIANPNFKKIV